MTLIIQKLRLQRGWSQQHLADISGLSVRTIQRLEGGQSPHLETIKSLAAVFQMEFHVLRDALNPSPIDASPTPSIESQATMSSLASPLPPSSKVSIPDDEARAFRDVRKLRGFYIHAIQYVVIVTALVVFNLWTRPEHLWSLWVMGGWGLGLLMHGLRVFKGGLLFGPDWERREIEKRIGRKL